MSVLDALSIRDLTELLDEVCRLHHVTREEICGRTRTKVVCAARHHLWWRLYHQDAGFSFVEIGRLFARNHTTVMHGIRAWARACKAAEGPPPRNLGEEGGGLGAKPPREEPLSLSA